VDALYDLIGGRQTVWAATDSFYRRVLADESVSHFFKTTDTGHLLARQSMFISMLLGGRVVYIYTGKDITTAHAQPREQGLNDTHFDAFLKHSRAAQSIEVRDRKSTRLNSSHVSISYAVFCLK